MPRKPPKPSLKLVTKQEPLTVAAQFLNNWKLILGAVLWAVGVLVLAGWNARGHKDELATKAELAPIREHIAAHDVEFGRFGQSLDDIKQTVHEIREDIRHK